MKKSKISIAVNDYQREVPCVIYHVDVDDNGVFRDADKYVATESNIKESWEKVLKAEVSVTITLDSLGSSLLFLSTLKPLILTGFLQS